MARPCYRNIDRPILVLGLEYPDWAAVLVFFCIFIVFPWLSNMAVLLMTVLFAAGLRVFKASKPPGYLIHLCYRWGTPLPWLLPPPRTITYYSAFPGRPTGLVWRRQRGSLPGSLEER